MTALTHVGGNDSTYKASYGGMELWVYFQEEANKYSIQAYKGQDLQEVELSDLQIKNIANFFDLDSILSDLVEIHKDVQQQLQDSLQAAIEDYEAEVAHSCGNIAADD